MKASQLTVNELLEYLHEDEPTPFLCSLLNASMKYICDYTGLTTEQVDAEGDTMVVAMLAVAAEFYDKRGVTLTDPVNENPTIAFILDSNRVNLV